jgi:hypothetical protein
MFPRGRPGYGPVMQIRRPVAALFASLALAGVAGGLTGCGADPIYSRTGTPADSARLTTGGDPHSDRQGNVPDLSNRPAGGTDTKGGVGAGGQNSTNG